MLCTWLAVASSAASADTIVSARFTEPTTRYAHGVLGDAVEYGALELSIQIKPSNKSLQTEGGVNLPVVTIRLPSDRVFEDLSPRLADVDHDGFPEVIVVESHQQTGAQLAIYNADGNKIAATPHIGTRFRWLAPVGAADLDGDGHVEIAYVDRPHLAKTLRIWRFQSNTLTEIAALPDLTNHRIGEDFISGGLRDCGSGPELIVASADWHDIISIRYDQSWVQTRLAAFTPSAMKKAMACSH
ncbi:MAG: FG-GAP repeat domain-containing protein [Ruegeria sp.]